MNAVPRGPRVTPACSTRSPAGSWDKSSVEKFLDALLTGRQPQVLARSSEPSRSSSPTASRVSCPPMPTMITSSPLPSPASPLLSSPAMPICSASDSIGMSRSSRLPRPFGDSSCGTGDLGAPANRLARKKDSGNFHEELKRAEPAEATLSSGEFPLHASRPRLVNSHAVALHLARRWPVARRS